MLNHAFPVFTLRNPKHFKETDRAQHQIQSGAIFEDFWRISNPPHELFVQGDPEALKLLSKLPQFGFSIVGTRYPIAATVQKVYEAIELLKLSKLIIISGLARGIDSAAHLAALDSKLPTIAVLACGIDVQYPKCNIQLRDRILREGGLVITEFPERSEPRKFNFLRRNRLIAGWGSATWVVEAKTQSGALNTARWAREQDKVCYATPCFPGSSFLSGNQKLIDDYQALPFWGPHCLGSVWIELSCLKNEKRTTCPSLHPNQSERIVANCPFEKLLLNWISEVNIQCFGADLHLLQNKARKMGWNGQEFFARLMNLMEMKQVVERNGLFYLGPHKGPV